jgi:hypothetical protein
MEILKWKKFNEQVEDEDLTTSNENKYEDLKSGVKSLLSESLGTEDPRMMDDFIKEYIKNPEETQIVGFINDSDVYEFYLKYRNDIDEILSDVNWYDEIPSENNIFSVYDYVIESTKKSVFEILNILVEQTNNQL